MDYGKQYRDRLHKLRLERVAHIRKLQKAGHSLAAIGVMLGGIKRQAVWNILNRK